MRTQFALDLRTARKQSGYTQKDLAHLLSANQSLVSELEHGKRRPTLEQIIDLSLIYAKSFESFFGQLMTERQSALLERLSTLPELTNQTGETFNRPSSIKRLQKRLNEAPLSMAFSVLAVAVSSYRAGYVLLADNEVQDWGTTAHSAKRNADLAAFLSELIETHRPDVVVTEALGPACRKGLDTKERMLALREEAARHEVLDISVPLPKAAPNKYEAGVVLVERHPALAGYLPKRRPLFYEATPRGYLLFDAVRLAEAALIGPDRSPDGE